MTDRRSKRLRDVSTEAQRFRLLERLHAGPVDTFELREQHNIAHPAGRVNDLRADGYPVLTHMGPVKDGKGIRHRLAATYYLSACAPPRAA